MPLRVLIMQQFNVHIRPPIQDDSIAQTDAFVPLDFPEKLVCLTSIETGKEIVCRAVHHSEIDPNTVQPILI